jgi:general secretion pathway protein E
MDNVSEHQPQGPDEILERALLDHGDVDGDALPTDAILPDRLSAQFLRAARALPIADTTTTVVLAMADPLDAYTVDAVRLAAEKEVEIRVATAREIDTALSQLYGAAPETMGDIVDSASGADGHTTEEDIARLRDMASEAPVVRLVSHLITKAATIGASDIHIEPFEQTLKVRFRIDGVLSDVESPPLALRPAIASRIKLMARLNIAESRLPQDGRIQVQVEGREIDLRVSTIPTLYGESIVLRLLDRGSVALELPALGFHDDSLEAYLSILEQPTGILLVTGPTGSGKTTTLYSSLVRLNSGDRKILTVEDPVEYHLDGVNQVQVRPQIGLGFSDALRSLLRQDPDIMMIGEIRDLETAEIAVQAALTGHKVLSTLHTNNAASTVTRLLDMGVEDYLLTSTLNGIVAQRLVRTVCHSCAEPHPVLPEIVDELALGRFFKDAEPVLQMGAGCDACGGTGYKGRIGIVEILVMTDRVRKAIVQRAGAQDLQRAAIEAGMTTMFEDGMKKAVAGLTTLDEILRVTREG